MEREREQDTKKSRANRKKQKMISLLSNNLIRKKIINKPILDFYINNRRNILVEQLQNLVTDYEYDDKVFFHALYSLDYVYTFGNLCLDEKCLENETHYYLLLACFTLASNTIIYIIINILSFIVYF